MRKIDRMTNWLGLLLVAAGLTACATTAQQPEEAPAAIGATEPSPAQSPTASTAAGSPAMINGYRRTVRDGKEFYCKRHVEAGTIARKVESCYPREELERMSVEGKDFLRRALENSSSLSQPL